MSKKKSLLSAEAKARQKEAAALKRQVLKTQKQIYKDRIKELRPYIKSLKKVDLRRNLTSGQKSFVTKAFDEFRALTIRPVKIVRSKNKSRLKEIQTFSGHSPKVKFDVAFVPSATKDAKIEIKKGRVIVTSKYVSEVSIPFDLKRLVSDPQAELERVIRENPEFTQFIVQVGEDGKFLFNGLLQPGTAAMQVMWLIERYSPGGAAYKGPQNHYSKWLYGLKGVKAKSQTDANTYLREYKNAAIEKKKAARKTRKSEAKKYGKR